MVKLLNVKPFRQSLGHCGAACLKIVLEYYDIQKSERELIKLVSSTVANGVGTERMALAIKKFNMRTVIKDNSTLKQIAVLLKKQIPIIVDWFSDYDGHYSVVVGLDRENIYMQDPELGHLRTMKRKAFMTVWFDFHGQYIARREDLIIRRMIIITPKRK
jgi:predicted double-glycine peptidase